MIIFKTYSNKIMGLSSKRNIIWTFKQEETIIHKGKKITVIGLFDNTLCPMKSIILQVLKEEICAPGVLYPAKLTSNGTVIINMQKLGENKSEPPQTTQFMCSDLWQQEP